MPSPQHKLGVEGRQGQVRGRVQAAWGAWVRRCRWPAINLAYSNVGWY